MNRRSVIVITAAAAVVIAVAACREPTSMHIVIRTDVPCVGFRGLSLAVGTSAIEAENAEPISVQRSCRGFILGDIYIGPNDGSKDGDFYVRAAVGTDTDVINCLPGVTTGCIVQRRHFRFAPGSALELKLDMALRCSGIACTPTTTCARTQRCVPSDADCIAMSDDRCTEADSVDMGDRGVGSPDGDGSPRGDGG